MFENIIDRWKYRKEIKEFNENPIIKSVMKQLYNNIKNIPPNVDKYLDTQTKKQILSQLLTNIHATISDLDPIEANRHNLIESMVELASFDVILISPNNQYKNVSGQLKQYLPELKNKNKNLKRFFHSYKKDISSVEEMVELMMVNYWQMKVYMNAYCLVGYKLDDNHWFKPCYNSLLTYFEHIYRTDLELPTILGHNAELKALLHFHWVNLCHTEEKNLLTVWNRIWKESVGEDSPYS